MVNYVAEARDGHQIQTIFPTFQDHHTLYTVRSFIIRASLIIIYSARETLWDTARFLPSIVPTARVAVGIILPLVFISSNLAISVASLLEGRFCFRWRSILTFSPTCLEMMGRGQISGYHGRAEVTGGNLSLKLFLKLTQLTWCSITSSVLKSVIGNIKCKSIQQFL